MNPSPKAYRRHARGLVGTFAVVVAFFTLVNTWINPIWVTPSPWTDEDFTEHRQIYRNLRTAKAGLAKSVPWNVAMIGSSRVAIALDPAIPQWDGVRAVNLGMSGASIHESAAMTRYVIENQENLERVILGIDLTDLSSDADLSRGMGFYESPLNPNGDSFERNLRYYVGFSTTEASYKTLRARTAGHIPPYTTTGHWAHHRVSNSTRNVLRKNSIPFAIRFIRQRKIDLSLSEPKVASFRKAIRVCLENNVELVLFIPPNHAAYMGVFPLEGDPDPFFMLDRRAIVRIVAEEQAKFPDAPEVIVWDFNSYQAPNCEPIPVEPEIVGKYWIDGTHSFESLGNVILSRIYGWPLEDPDEADYGQILTPENIDQREEILARGYEEYTKQHPDDWNFTKEVIRDYEQTSTVSEPPSS